MTFEEFFKKKKINLTVLSNADGALFAEFKTHYQAMGEKSFDHTKKYWFNKLRRLYPLPPDVKAEKLVIENQLAEQTIIETLTEPATQPAKPKAGFTPRFKAGAAAKPVEDGASAEPASNAGTNLPTIPKKAGFTPRFKAGATTSKPEVVKNEPELKPEITEQVTPAPKAGFTPRFKAGVTKPKTADGSADEAGS